MKINSLVISNFRGINRLDTGILGETVIIAGQNGSGKSCIFDGIRLLKSVYGGYQQNEWQHFFNEFQIQLQGVANLRSLFNDFTKPLEIKATFKLRDREKAYINTHAAELLEETIWQSVLPEAFQFGGYRKALFAVQFREKRPEVQARVSLQLPALLEQLTQSEHVGRVTIDLAGQINLADSLLLNVVFATYRPRNIGVIDFHGAQRHYGRENVQGIHLNLDAAKQNKSQSSLYNYSAKYNNVKSEMAGNFISEMLAEKAGAGLSDGEQSLSDSMMELFNSFFPDKEFLGPQPTDDGTLAFPVKTANGTIHDLDELSSGEKEILYGYLRIRSSAPRDSIILLDEPELHLNPRLIRGLPEFYRKHLGESLENQLWLVTHSDALIREAVGKPGFNVFHMLPCGVDSLSASQLKPLMAGSDLEQVMTDLVGDLATYRPGGKGVIFEGGGDSDFDKTLVQTLFAEEVRGINLISGSNKTKVRALHEVLSQAHAKGDLPTKFFAVVDRDFDLSASDASGITQFSWNVYHIENYLLEPKYVAEAINSFRLEGKVSSEEVLEQLNAAARLVVPSVLIKRMTEFANSQLISGINLGFDPATLTIGADLRKAVERSFERISSAASAALSTESLAAKETELRSQIQTSFGDGSWLSNIPGRDILKKLVLEQKIQTNYEGFRNIIVTKMAAAGFKPSGMAEVIAKIRAG